VLYKGEIVEHKSTGELFANPTHPYTKGLLACRPPLDSRPIRLYTVADYLSGNVDANPLCETAEQRSLRHKQIYSQPPILQVNDLEVTYPLKKSFTGKVLQSLTAVDKVSFDVYRGETLGLVGESGCGKTTLGRALMRLIDKSSGSITFEGTRLDTLSRKDMRMLRPKVQIIFQDPYSSLNPRITVGDAIMEPLRVWNKGGKNNQERKQYVIDLMKEVGLDEEHYNRYPHEFSGGQRQRVCIARALALKPSLVVCDESVSALDVSVQAQVLNLLNDLKNKWGFTYIFISHDLSVVKFLADRLMIMRQGKVVEMGDADDIYANPQQEYTRNLIEAIPKVESNTLTSDY
jgi:peptide/nickel transport system ATP-binding protein